mgnify:CR=1 FL=1
MLQLVWSSFDTWPAGWREQSAACLSGGERERLARIRSPGRADQFLAGRLLARQLVAEHSGAAPSTVSLAPSAPTRALGSTGTPLCHLSISHCGSALAVAIGSQPVGVDCEQVAARRNWREIAANFFCESEAQWLSELPPQQGAREFVRLWTAKEAVSKCSGENLLRVLAQVEVLRGDIHLPPGWQPLNCWSAELSESLLLSLTAEMAPAQVSCQFRAQPALAGGKKTHLLPLRAHRR